MALDETHRKDVSIENWLRLKSLLALFKATSLQAANGEASIGTLGAGGTTLRAGGRLTLASLPNSHVAVPGIATKAQRPQVSCRSLAPRGQNAPAAFRRYSRVTLSAGRPSRQALQDRPQDREVC